MVLKMLRYSGAILAAMATMAMSSPVVVESLDETPAGWEEVSSPAPGKLIKLSIGMQPEDHERFERTLYEISDPSHANYGRHLSRDAAKALLNPSQVATESVKRWLSDAGIADRAIDDDGQWIHIRTTVSQAEGLLSTRFGVFARDDEHVVRTREYSVPGEVRDHITSIQPTTFFHSLNKSRKIKRSAPYLAKKGPSKERSAGYGDPVDLEQCKVELTPACLRKLYKMPANTYPTAHRKALYAIAGFNEVRTWPYPLSFFKHCRLTIMQQAAQYDQLEEFLRRFAPDQQGTGFSVSLVNGGQNLQGEYPSGEANLNIQYAVALADEVPVQFISVGGENHDFNTDLE